LDLLLKELRNNVSFNYGCKHFKMNPSEGGMVEDVMVESIEGGIVQFALDPVFKKAKTHRKGASVNVQTKSLQMYIADLTFSVFPHLLLVNPICQIQMETKVPKRQTVPTTQISHQGLHFNEAITLKPHVDNPDQQEVPYTLIVFTVFSEDPDHYRVYCKGETEWYLFNDDNTIKKPGDIALRYGEENILTQVTSLYYVKDAVEKAEEKLVQEGDNVYDVDM
jgi:hypothetical protein